MLHFIFDFILKSQPSRPSPLMPFTKTTGPEGIYSLKARPWLLTPSLFIYTQPRTSQCIPEMALVTLAIGNLRWITLPQVKKYKSRFLRCFYFFSIMTPAGFHHSRGGYIHPDLFPHSCRTVQVFSTGIACSLWSLYKHATYFYYFI